jgi:hypothetical protein
MPTLLAVLVGAAAVLGARGVQEGAPPAAACDVKNNKTLLQSVTCVLSTIREKVEQGVFVSPNAAARGALLLVLLAVVMVLSDSVTHLYWGSSAAKETRLGLIRFLGFRGRVRKGRGEVLESNSNAQGGGGGGGLPAILRDVGRTTGRPIRLRSVRNVVLSLQMPLGSEAECELDPHLPVGGGWGAHVGEVDSALDKKPRVPLQLRPQEGSITLASSEPQYFARGRPSSQDILALETISSVVMVPTENATEDAKVLSLQPDMRQRSSRSRMTNTAAEDESQDAGTAVMDHSDLDDSTMMSWTFDAFVNPNPKTLRNPKPESRNPEPPPPEPPAPNPTTPKPQTPNPKPQTSNPKPQTPNP